jgi:hypothetical protein
MQNTTVENRASENILRYLPGKYSTLATYTFWIVDQIRDKFPEAVQEVERLTSLKTGDIPIQIAFYEEFFSQKIELQKALKKSISNKKDKAPRKPRKTKTEDSGVEPITNNDIISQIVSRANAVEQALPTESVSTTKETNPVEGKKIIKKIISKEEKTAKEEEELEYMRDEALEELEPDPQEGIKLKNILNELDAQRRKKLH